MKPETRHKIIEAGARIIHHKGFHYTGIQEILAAANVPKGSFYFYFKSKEDFGLNVIDYFDTLFYEMLKPIISDSTLPFVDRIANIFDFFIEYFEEIAFTCGCPIGNLSQEMGDLNDTFSQRLSDSVKNMARIYQNLLDNARDNGEISSAIDTPEMAEFIVTSWHGALIKMKINKSVQPLNVHKNFILAALKR